MDDFDRLRPQEPYITPPVDPYFDRQPRSPVPWIAFAVVAVLILAAVWWFAPRTSHSPAEAVGRTPVVDDTVVERPIADPTRLGVGEPDPNLPALGALDGYVRPLLSALSLRPELVALLASDDLVRRFVVSVEAVARGASPAGQVRAVAPKGSFLVRQQGNEYVIDPASFARYEGMVEMVEDLDPQRLARLYGQMKPRLEEAYAELGVGGTFDGTITRALAHLLATPVPATPPRVEPARGTNYVYTDARLEELSPAQRHLLRLGPERARRVQAHLRAFALALGIPANQLPAP